jgi:hypothetical protein
MKLILIVAATVICLLHSANIGFGADPPKPDDTPFLSLLPDEFPGDVVVINFDTAPNGDAIVVGQDLSTVYKSKGCTIDSNIEGSDIIATDYRIRKAGGLSAGNREPLYQGGMTIRFFVPELGMDKPGGVHLVGFHTAYVSVGGVALVAYGEDGKAIGEIRNTKRGNDFIGMKSKVPIAYVEIKAVPMVDKDFAIDNLMFDVPKRLSKMPLP